MNLNLLLDTADSWLDKSFSNMIEIIKDEPSFRKFLSQNSLETSETLSSGFDDGIYEFNNVTFIFETDDDHIEDISKRNLLDYIYQLRGGQGTFIPDRFNPSDIIETSWPLRNVETARRDYFKDNWNSLAITVFGQLCLLDPLYCLVFCVFSVAVLSFVSGNPNRLLEVVSEKVPKGGLSIRIVRSSKSYFKHVLLSPKAESSKEPNFLNLLQLVKHKLKLEEKKLTKLGPITYFGPLIKVNVIVIPLNQLFDKIFRWESRSDANFDPKIVALSRDKDERNSLFNLKRKNQTAK